MAPGMFSSSWTAELQGRQAVHAIPAQIQPRATCCRILRAPASRRMRAHLATQRCRAAADLEGQSPNVSGPPAMTPNTGFGSLEKLVASQAVKREDGGRNDWLEVEGCWVLPPPPGAGPAKAVVLFCGGAFAGAAPQLTYRLLLECLAKRDVLVVAVPFNTGFNHTRIADEVQYKFDRCMAVLAERPSFGGVATLPLFGIGHSLGSLVQLLASTRFASQRAGNALLSFNNKPLDDVPLIAPFLGPAAQVLGPLLTQLSTSPARSALLNVLEGLRRTSPALVQQFLPVLDQLEPIYLDLAAGRKEFVPHPEETAEQLRAQYAVPRNLIIQFRNDTLDESPRLHSVLQSNSMVARQLQYKVLPGDHTRPLLQTVGDLPAEVRQAASAVQSQGGELLNRLSSAAVQAGFSQASQSFSDIARGITNVGTALNGSLASTNAATTAEMQSLADEVADWMFEAPVAALPPAGQATV